MSDFTSVEREISAQLDGLTGAEASKALARFAAEQRDRVIADAGSARPHVTTYVDGREGAALEAVRPTGVIRFEFSYATEAVGYIFGLLVQRSPFRPKRPGATPATHYRDEHQVLLNGAEIEPALVQRVQLNPGDELVFVNVQPYARKVERGFGPKLKAAHGVYEQVARLAKQRFGNTADIRYAWRVIPGAGPRGPKSRRGGAGSHRQDDSFPAITVRAR